MDEPVSSAIFLKLDLAELVAVIGSPLLFALAVWLGVSVVSGKSQRY